MSDEKNLNQEAEPQAEEESASASAHDAAEEPAEESAADQRRKRVNDALGNLEESAKAVGEKTSVIAGQVFEKLKQGVSQAYATGSKVVGELSDTATDYAEQYKTSAEIRKLNGDKNTFAAELGALFYTESRKPNATWEKIAGSETAEKLFTSISELDAQIVEVGKRLDASKESE